MNTLQPRIELLDMAVDDDSPRHDFEPTGTAFKRKPSLKAAGMAAERALTFHRLEMNQARGCATDADHSPASRAAWLEIEKHHTKAVEWLAAFVDVLTLRETAGDGFVNYATSGQQSKDRNMKLKHLVLLSSLLASEPRISRDVSGPSFEKER